MAGLSTPTLQDFSWANLWIHCWFTAHLTPAHLHSSHCLPTCNTAGAHINLLLLLPATPLLKSLPWLPIASNIQAKSFKSALRPWIWSPYLTQSTFQSRFTINCSPLGSPLQSSCPITCYLTCRVHSTNNRLLLLQITQLLLLCDFLYFVLFCYNTWES